MANGRLQTLHDIFRPRIVRWSAAILAALPLYDVFSNQFNFPKLGKVMGVTGNLLPWWGWLLIMQAVFVYALFEYVRQTLPSLSRDISPSLEARIVRLEETKQSEVPFDDSDIKAAQAAFEERIMSLVQGMQEQIDGFGYQINAIESRRVAEKRLRMLELAKEEFDRLAPDVIAAAAQVFDAFECVPQSLERLIAVADTRSDVDKALDNFKLQAVFTHGWAERLGYECPAEFDDAAYRQKPHKAAKGEPDGLPEYYQGEYRSFVAQKEFAETLLQELEKKLNMDMAGQRRTLEA